MKTLLKKYFGYEEFRPLQAEIINSALEKKDSFVLMATGTGKSLCYQLPALKLPGLTLVISPLIALMKDQVDALQACGVNAEFINSSLLPKQIEEVCERVKNKEVKLLYIAPERFSVVSFQEFLKTIEISLIAIDEAHCISEWGHDFRPDYRNLSLLKERFPSVPLMALTATATTKVRDDVVGQLNLVKPEVFVSSFDRENLNISVIAKKQAFGKLVNILDKYKNESVIIYCYSRKETEEIAENLKLNGFSAKAYHAGLVANKRKRTQELFIKDKVNIIVATVAFGMGIDKPDVRLIVHYSYPKTLEGYYQEIGRAGRDGLISECILFYTYADTRKHEFFINQIHEPNLNKQAHAKLNEVITYCELSTCRKKYLLNYFGEKHEKCNCKACDNCLEVKEMFDATIVTKKIISAILRTDSRFGKNYIIDILLGKKVQKIILNKHDKLSVHGIINDFNKDELDHIIKQLLDLSFINKSDGEYPVLGITKKGAEFLNNNSKIEVAKLKVDSISEKVSKKEKLDYDSELFEQLRSLRKEIADKENVPPFIIFGDTSLQEMAYYFPQDKITFSKISGVGTKKLEQYSLVFIEVIKKYTKENNISIQETPVIQQALRKAKTKIPKQIFYNKTKELLIKKIPIDRIAKNQKLTESTVINHVEKLIDSGEKLDLEYLKLPIDRFEVIKNAFEECGDEKLKPVFEYLNGKYAYEELKIVRVLLLQ